MGNNEGGAGEARRHRLDYSGNFATEGKGTVAGDRHALDQSGGHHLTKLIGFETQLLTIFAEEGIVVDQAHRSGGRGVHYRVQDLVCGCRGIVGTDRYAHLGGGVVSLTIG